jgi:hypothetical protein
MKTSLETTFEVKSLGTENRTVLIVNDYETITRTFAGSQELLSIIEEKIRRNDV